MRKPVLWIMEPGESEARTFFYGNAIEETFETEVQYYDGLSEIPFMRLKADDHLFEIVSGLTHPKHAAQGLLLPQYKHLSDLIQPTLGLLHKVDPTKIYIKGPWGRARPTKQGKRMLDLYESLGVAGTIDMWECMLGHEILDYLPSPETFSKGEVLNPAVAELT